MNDKNLKILLEEVIAPLRQDIKELKDVQENRLLLSVIETELTLNHMQTAIKSINIILKE